MEPEAWVKDLFKEIAGLKLKKAELEETLKAKEAMALNFMKKNEADNIDAGYGKFYKIPRPIYSYSPEVTKAEEEIKLKKKDEVANGIATVKSCSFSLRFNAKKED